MSSGYTVVLGQYFVPHFSYLNKLHKIANKIDKNYNFYIIFIFICTFNMEFKLKTIERHLKSSCFTIAILGLQSHTF